MKAAVVYTPGAAGNLTLIERPVPTPTDGQVLVKVKALGLNRSELMTRKGLSPDVIFPRILGIECVGEVTFDPSGEYPEGQQVMALMGGMGRAFDGSYCEFTVLPKSILHPIHSMLPGRHLALFRRCFKQCMARCSWHCHYKKETRC